MVNETDHISIAGDFNNRNEDITTGILKNVIQIVHYIKQRMGFYKCLNKSTWIVRRANLLNYILVNNESNSLP